MRGKRVSLNSADWHVIDAAFSPRVASSDSPHSHPRPANNAVTLDRLEGEVGARGVIAADIAVKRRDHRAIGAQDDHANIAGEENNEQQCPSHCLLTPLSMLAEISSCRVAQETSGDPGNARITMSVPVAWVAKTSRPTERRRRRTKLRVTALPTVFATMKPKRVGSPEGRGWRYTTAWGEPTRLPLRTAERKSSALTTRFALVSTGWFYAESSVRPLARRAARIERPARVRIRKRKPCTLARRRLFGWKVLLLIVVSPKPSFEGRKEVGCPKAGSQLIKSTASRTYRQTLSRLPACCLHGIHPQLLETPCGELK